MSDIISLDQKKEERNREKGDAIAFRVICRAIMDEKLSRADLRALARTVLERRGNNGMQVHLASKEFSESCKKIMDLGYLESDGPFEHIFEDGESAGWFQFFRFKGFAA